MLSVLRRKPYQTTTRLRYAWTYIAEQGLQKSTFLNAHHTLYCADGKPSINALARIRQLRRRIMLWQTLQLFDLSSTPFFPGRQPKFTLFANSKVLVYFLCLQQDLYLSVDIKFLTAEPALDVEARETSANSEADSATDTDVGYSQTFSYHLLES